MCLICFSLLWYGIYSFLGSAMECVYALQSFGIPSNQIPLVVGATNVNNKRRKKETKRNAAATAGENSNNNNNNNNTSNHLKLENHIKWFELCELKDSNIKLCGKTWKSYDNTHHGYNGHQQIIEVPKHSDILFGRVRTRRCVYVCVCIRVCVCVCVCVRVYHCN